jgi:hypothetical protein
MSSTSDNVIAVVCIQASGAMTNVWIEAPIFTGLLPGARRRPAVGKSPGTVAGSRWPRFTIACSAGKIFLYARSPVAPKNTRASEGPSVITAQSAAFCSDGSCCSSSCRG